MVFGLIERMKKIMSKIECTFFIPNFNLKLKYREIWDSNKYDICMELIKQKYVDLNPQFTQKDNKLIIVFDMTNCPKYDILTSIKYFNISKQSVLDKLKQLRGQANEYKIRNKV